MDKLDIEYNSGKAKIRYPEYGRGIQELLQHACTIEDPRLRQKTVESIVHMMQMLNPNRTGVEDYRERLWNHAFAIAEYKLDVKPPNGVQIRLEHEKPKAEPIGYPQPNLRFRHYGVSVQKLMDKAIEMPEGPKKEGFVEVIASYMKLAYKTWSREHYVSDDIVKEDLESMTDGQLELHEGHSSLDTLSYHAGKKERELQRQQHRNRKKNGVVNTNTMGAEPASSNRNRRKRGGSANSSSGSGGGNYRRRKR
jgi:Domain of unknown function (DUF4290)